jgi:hypothetical protein
MSTEFWIGLLIALGTNVATIAATFGGFSARLKALECKVDKHNNFVERVYRLEGRCDGHDREIKELKEEN